MFEILTANLDVILFFLFLFTVLFLFVFCIVIALRIWSGTEIQKKQLEEDSKTEKARVYATNKEYLKKMDCATDLKMAAAQELLGDDNDELGQAMQILQTVMGNGDNPPVSAGDSAVINELQAFAQTPDGAEAMAKFQSFQQNKGIDKIL